MTVQPDLFDRIVAERFLDDRVTLYPGDCRTVIATLADNSIDSVVTDPPYALVSIVKRFGGNGAKPPKDGDVYARSSAGFMGKRWDNGETAFTAAFWAEVYRVLKPGGHVVSCGGTRTYHRLVCAIEDAGFEIRDQLAWVYGSGFPKSHDVSKGIDRAAGAERSLTREGTIQRDGYGNDWDTGSSDKRPRYDAPATDAARQWQGWGTALKPAWEPICLARKPLIGTVAENVLAHGTGAINVNGCRVEGTPSGLKPYTRSVEQRESQAANHKNVTFIDHSQGRWPANLVHDGSDEVLAAFPDAGAHGVNGTFVQHAWAGREATQQNIAKSEGSAARFFYQVKGDQPCHSIKSASDAAESFALQSEHVVSALGHAVERSTPRLVLHKASYRAHDMNVSDQQLRLIVASVTEAMQSIERRFSLGLLPESITAQLDLVTCVAIPNPIGTTTITVSLSTSGHCVEAVTFNTIATSEEVGAQGFAKRRFHYTAKADASDRIGSRHPTVKPVDLMQWLVRLVTPKGGVCLDPFAGSGTTGEAAFREGMRCVLVEREAEYCAEVRARMSLAREFAKRNAVAKSKGKLQGAEGTPLFSQYDSIRDGIESYYAAIAAKKARGDSEGWA